MKTKTLLAFCVMIAAAAAGRIQANVVVDWSIDSSQSFVRLNLNDTNHGSGLGSTGFRDQTDLGSPVASSWTDTGKKLAALSGFLSSTMSANDITFVLGSHAAPAVASGQFRPDAASWNGSTFNTGNGATTPSVFAADILWQPGVPGAPGVLNSQVGFVNFYDVNTNYGGTVTGFTNYSGTGSGSLTVGLASGTTLDFDRTGPFPINDLLTADGRASLSAVQGTAALTGANTLTIAHLGGLTRRLTLTYSVPVTLSLPNFGNGGNLLYSGTIDSTIVAFGTVPEPASVSLLGIALAFSAFRRCRSVLNVG